MSDLDILLVNVPAFSPSYPPAATTLLKGAVQDRGHTAKVLDLNLDLYSRVQKDRYNDIFDVFMNVGLPTPEENEIIEQFIDEWATQIAEINPRWVGISVFTFQCQVCTEMLTRKLRSVYDGQIVIGGAGLSSNGISARSNDFGAYLLDKGLIDYYIRGDGELALIELLQGITEGPGINNDGYQQIRDLDQFAFPDYSDVIGLDYPYQNEVLLPINGSRGCVRACTFCDIHTFWNKFTFRSGESLAREMIQNYEKHGVKHYTFTDSLINGSMKQFRELLTTLVQYYHDNDLPMAFFRFSGQFIVRNEKQQSAQDYRLMAQAGCDNLVIGVETGSDEVRAHMQKKFSTDELRFVMKQFSENGLNCFFSMISGYPTETLENHKETLDLFREFQKYALDGTIVGMNLGSTLSIDEGTPLYDNMDKYGWISLGHENPRVGLHWFNPELPDLTIDERLRRRIETQEVATDLGYIVWNGDRHLKMLMKSYERIKNGTY